MQLIEMTYLFTLSIHVEMIGKKVHTVQALRKIFKLSLKEAKAIVDSWDEWDNEDPFHEPFYRKRKFKVNAHQFAYAYCVLHNDCPTFTDAKNEIVPSFTFRNAEAQFPTNYNDISCTLVMNTEV